MEFSNLMILILVIAIIKVIAVYSVGRSHGGKLQLHFPKLNEWVIIIVIVAIIGGIGGYVGREMFKTDIENMGL